MYRVQISGNHYIQNQECGLHYQLHRGIGIHHQSALEVGQPLKVSIFVGGPPAHAFAAVMPLPEAMPELAFAGVLAGRSFRYVLQEGWVISADADFCILGEIASDLKPEGPFGDHLGYYSLQHDFPYLKVRAVYHRPGAIWPFTTVGRPPQEDTTFGEMIHALTASAVPSSLPGIREVHAVDVAGVHPLCLAIGSERDVPYAPREPQELLTQANALLGFGQISLAKYLWIAAGEDAPKLSTHNIVEFFSHILERVDFSRDLHFQTRSTIDTLDYSGSSLNHGSKLVIAAAGLPCRTLGKDASSLGSLKLPLVFGSLRMVMPGVIAVQSPPWQNETEARELAARLCVALEDYSDREQWPLVCMVDDSEFVARNVANWLWVCFTRSNPSHDIFGVSSTVTHKHWGCSAPLVIDARIKSHHSRPLEEDPAISRRVDSWFAPHGALHGLG
jgi:4-hydroxy-3-polyprenylbenzoate decarboxylase